MTSKEQLREKLHEYLRPAAEAGSDNVGDYLEEATDDIFNLITTHTDNAVKKAISKRRHFYKSLTIEEEINVPIEIVHKIQDNILSELEGKLPEYRDSDWFNEAVREVKQTIESMRGRK